MSMNQLLLHARLRKNAAKPPSMRCRPRLETLEDRRMMAAHPWFDRLDDAGAVASDTDYAGVESWTGPHEKSPLRSPRDVSVMSWNLYLGGDLGPVLEALGTGQPELIVGAVTGLWQSVLATNFEIRAEAIADQIELEQPTLIGLQEAVVWSTGPVDPENSADDVQFNFTEILLETLGERGLHYTVVADTQQIDAELTGYTTPPSELDPDGKLEDIRLTDHDVILARADLPTSRLKLSNVQEENFDFNLSFPLPDGQTFTVLRGWNSVDVKIRGKEFRLINTHLEVSNFEVIQELQARELLLAAANTQLPVVLLGDFNSAAVPNQPNDTNTYEILIEAGFQDTWNLTQEDQSFTCCQAADLRNETSDLESRIDLVLIRGPLKAIDTLVVGEDPADRTESLPSAPLGLWPSDHAGVAATLKIPSRWHHRVGLADHRPCFPSVREHSQFDWTAGSLKTAEYRQWFPRIEDLDHEQKQVGRKRAAFINAVDHVFNAYCVKEEYPELLDMLASKSGRNL
jgi:hypothetical protein